MWAALALVGSMGTVMATAAAPAVDVERILRGMTREQKVAQLMLVGFGGTRLTPHMRHWVQARQVGGVVLFSRNIVDLAQTGRLTRDLIAQVKKSVPIFVALDQEGGNVVRIREGATVLPGNMALGATREPALAYVAGQAVGIDLRLLGFNMNLAPVLDVNSNPQNPVIGVRSYGERADLVAGMGEWFVRGQQEMGVMSVAKHFPGHGDTQTDSHFGMPTITADMARLDEVELVPFRQVIGSGIDAIMTAHIALPRIGERADLPATLSRRILTDLLRERLKFAGVIVTDGLEMQGIVQRFGSGRAAVLAVVAGADMPMVLWSDQAKEEVYQALLGAVRTGEIGSARLDQSVRRILTAKAHRGLFGRTLEPLDQVIKSGNRNDVHLQVADRIAQAAVTLVRNHGDILPMRAEARVVVMAPPGPFARRLSEFPHVRVILTPYSPRREERVQIAARLAALAAEADLVMAVVVNRYHVDMVRALKLAVPRTPLALLSFASPYYLRQVPQAEAYVCTYSFLDSAQNAAAEAVLGKQPMRGRLPVSIPGFYAFGHRIEDRVSVAPTAVAD